MGDNFQLKIFPRDWKARQLNFGKEGRIRLVLDSLVKSLDVGNASWSSGIKGDLH
jgi:hypothetical protein